MKISEEIEMSYGFLSLHTAWKNCVFCINSQRFGDFFLSPNEHSILMGYEAKPFPWLFHIIKSSAAFLITQQLLMMISYGW